MLLYFALLKLMQFTDTSNFDEKSAFIQEKNHIQATGYYGHSFRKKVQKAFAWKQCDEKLHNHILKVMSMK